jgi:hypothetical protein
MPRCTIAVQGCSNRAPLARGSGSSSAATRAKDDRLTSLLEKAKNIRQYRLSGRTLSSLQAEMD